MNLKSSLKMKKISFVTLMLLAVTSMSFAQTITGTPHDMSAQAWNTMASNKLCGVCHTPHNAMAVSQAPLWSHTTSSAVYTMYTSAQSSTFNATPGAAPSGNSLLCLSCHDGTVALNNHVGNTLPLGSTLGVAYPTTTTLVGTALTNDHPVSFTYDAALVTADGALRPTTTAALGGTIATKMLFGGKMECASCHNPHNNQYTSFQRMTNNASQLCLTCHIK